MDRLLWHKARSVPEWPSADRNQLLAVTEMTRYLDIHSAQLSTCAGAMDGTLPLMTVETFPCLLGDVRAVLDSLPWFDHWPHITVISLKTPAREYYDIIRTGHFYN